MVSTARKLKLDEMPQPDSEIVSKAMQRRVLICMCVMIFFNHLSLGNIIPSIALYARSFGVLQWAIGLAVGISGFSRLLAAFPAGAIAEKFGRKNGLAVGAITTAVGSLLCAFAPNYIVFLIGRFISGIGTGIVQISGQIVLLDITTPKNRGKTMAIYRSVSTFAMGIGPFPGGLLATHYGLQAPFISNIVTGCFTAILAWFLVPETQGFAEADAKKAKAAFKGTFFEKMKTLFKLPGFALISFIGFMISSTRQGGFTSIVPVIGHDRLLLTPDKVGFSIALSSFVGLLVGYPAGVLGDKYGQKTVIVPATILAGISMSLFLFAPTYAWFLTGCIFWTAAISISGLAPVAYTANLAPKGLNSATVSSYHVFADAGLIVGPLIMGLSADLIGVNTTLLISIVLLMMCGILFYLKAPNVIPK